MAATVRAQSENKPSLIFMMFALWTAVTRLRSQRSAYSNAKCAMRVDAPLGDDFQALDDAGHDLVLEAGVEILGVLAHDDEVESRIGRPNREAFRPAVGWRTIELLAQPTLAHVAGAAGCRDRTLERHLAAPNSCSTSAGSASPYFSCATTPISIGTHSISRPDASTMRHAASTLRDRCRRRE